jgi:AraC-like DNA-binding protein
MRNLFDEFGHGSLPRLPRHKNPGLEIVYLRHGHLVWECDGKQEAVRPDSVYFTLPWQAHGSVMEFEPGHEWYFVVIRLHGADTDKPRPFGFPRELAFDAATTAAVRRLLTRAPRHAWPATPLARVLLPALMVELERPGPFHRARVIQMTGQLILELARILSLPESSGERRDAERFSKLLAELQRTCDEPWTLGQMAARLGLKRTQFSTLFRHAIGDAPMHYLSRLRVEKSRHLLQTTKKTITEIALECGFSSSQHFARVFQQFTGETATAYRCQGPPALLLPRKQRWR